MSQSKISRLENCRYLPTLTDLRTLCEVYNVADNERSELLDLAASVREASKQTRLVMPRGAAQLQRLYADMEAKARVVRNYCPTIVPGILQTADYVRAIFQDVISGDDLEETVAGRLARGQAALGDDSKQLVYVMTEGALRWQLGSASLMAAQVDAIVEATRKEHLRIGIIPWTTPVHVICTHSFNLYDEGAVVVGTEVSAGAFTRPEDVQLYVDLFAQLEAAASFGEEARRELARIANDYRLLA